MGDRSVIRMYVEDFLEHLESVAEHRRKFKRFYPHWKRMREQHTIVKLQELLEMLKNTEYACEFGIAAGSAAGIGGAIGTLATFLATGAVSPVAIAVKCAGHGFKAGFAAGKATAVSMARTTTAELIDRDYNETARLVEMGLSFNGVLREMREIVENIKRLTLTYTFSELVKELGLRDDDMGNHNAVGGAHHQVAQYLVQAVHDMEQADARNISNILNSFVQYNPDYLRAAHAAGQTGFDLLGFTRWMNLPVLGTALNFEHLYVAGSLVSMGLDFKDLAQSIMNLRSGGSVNQKMVEKVMNRYKEELAWMESVYRELSDNS